MPKILVSGDVGGNLTALFQRVSTVNSGAAGPFECLFCVGEVGSVKPAFIVQD